MAGDHSASWHRAVAELESDTDSTPVCNDKMRSAWPSDRKYSTSDSSGDNAPAIGTLWTHRFHSVHLCAVRLSRN
eukprot:Skav215560  [mRNA]  locus=scaffold1793:31254:32181:- [translate_table: standard]